MNKNQRVRIAHISDPHFGTTTPKKIAALTNALKNLRLDVVALSGDITQRARGDQFRDAKKFCIDLAPLPIIAVPGNHDIPLVNVAARALWPYLGFRRSFGFATHSHRAFGAVEIAALNTTDPKRHVQGAFNKKSAEELRQFSESALVRIAMFHHPMDCAKATDEKNLLRGAPLALGHLEASKVDIVLGGHIHDPLARLTNTRYPHARRPLLVAVAGTCLSSRTRSGAPNSFNLIEIQLENEKVVVSLTRYDLSVQNNFLPVSELKFRREDRDHWIDG